jgi:hypothetical protein
MNFFLGGLLFKTGQSKNMNYWLNCLEFAKSFVTFDVELTERFDFQ